MIARAYAKINLALEVTGRRADGYHEIVSVMQLITLHDEISFDLSGEISLACDVPGMSGEDNLVVRAARLLQDASHSPLGASIRLVKRIPSPGGLGGGSADAAATLKALARLWRLHLSRRRLIELAASLGSDVPFFFFGPTALAEGKGEVLTALRAPVSSSVLLAVPRLDMETKTARLYSALSPRDYSDGSQARALAKALEEGVPLAPTLMVNVFEPIVLRRLPKVQACREAFLAAGAPWVRLSGSGPALYSIISSREQARGVYARLRGLVHAADVAVILSETQTNLLS